MELPVYKRSWVLRELQQIMPDEGLRVLDLGCGTRPLPVRPQDTLVTADQDPKTGANVVGDLTANWPFAAQEFDLVYAGHVVEHFYPPARDLVVRRIHESLRAGGYFFFRVPHLSSMQATGWEHHTYYGLNGACGLCHGRNPSLPWFRAVAFGASMISAEDFYHERQGLARGLDRLLNKSFRLTDRFLAALVGGINEVQFLLQRLPAGHEARLQALL